MKPDESVKWLIENPTRIVKFSVAMTAKRFDSYTEDIVNKVMCSDLCPCYYPSGEEELRDKSWNGTKTLTTQETDAILNRLQKTKKKYDQFAEFYINGFGRTNELRVLG